MSAEDVIENVTLMHGLESKCSEFCWVLHSVVTKRELSRTAKQL